MGIMDQFRKSRETGQEKHETPPPRGHTVAEILQDRSKSDLFGKLLKRDGQEELGRRMFEGKLEESDIDLLSKYRLEFSEKVAQSEKVENLLTKETVIEIARQHPSFAKIIDIVPPEKVIRAIQSQLREKCFTDEDEFNAIAAPIEAYDSYKNGAGKEIEDGVEKLCKDMGISPKEYFDALAIEDPKEKREALKKLAKGNYETSQKVWNIISGENRKNLRGLKDYEILLESSAAELDNYKNAIGSTLFLSVSGNDDMRGALSRELVSENAPAEEPKGGFKDAKKETFNEKEFNEEWKGEKIDTNYDNVGASEQEAIRNSFIDRAKKHYREKTKAKGFWASVLTAMFEGKINSKKDTLK